MSQSDRDVLRRLAERWMTIANQPVMTERRRQWTALKDLRAERPMVLFETYFLEDYVRDDELECEDPMLRGIEGQLRHTLRHAEEVGDDIVLPARWSNHWDVSGTGWGIEVECEHAVDTEDKSTGYSFDHPIRTPADLDRLRPQEWSVDRDSSLNRFDRLTDAFGDILPVVQEGNKYLHGGLTSNAFRLTGNDNLLMWPYDEPDAMHRLMAYLRDDRLSYLRFMEEQGLLALNNDSTAVGSGSPGFTTALPTQSYRGKAQLSDMWMWMESQETTMISPVMFEEFFLPYMAEVAKLCGLVYYGCCEPVHDRWKMVRESIPNIRAVSISPWCDQTYVAEQFGRDYVFSRKPKPAPISGATPDWETLREDVESTLAAAEGCNLEFVFRDVYRINGDRPRVATWVQMVRERIEAG
jgi:hypothetical protein